MLATFYLGYCRHYKTADEELTISENSKSDCKKCLYFSSYNCGMPQVHNSVGEHLGSMH